MYIVALKLLELVIAIASTLNFIKKHKALIKKQPKSYYLQNNKEILTLWSPTKSPEEIVREFYGTK